MPKGKAHGVDREYQVACREYLVSKRPELVPYTDDGIDIPFSLPDTTWTFDVAMRNSEGGLVVAECRRTIDHVKQEAIAAFAFKVESLRSVTQQPVAAFFFTKTHHQLGAVRVGQFCGISTVVMGEDTSATGYDLVFYTYDPEREKCIRRFVLDAQPGRYTLRGGEVTFTHTRVDGSVEKR